MPAGSRRGEGTDGKGWRRMACRLALVFVLALLPTLGVAQTEPGLGAHDSSQPIEIVADRLTVQQADGRAVFEGNVVAEQGEMALSAARLVVFYQLGEDDAASQQAIRRIEVEGDVRITSPSESATGDSGYYDVVGEEIVLTGNVVLTREANVVTGDRLEIDVARQLATMSTADAGKGRVRALFQPSAGG